MNEEQSWKIIRNYYKECGLVEYQIQSFNDFIHFGMQDIVDQEADIEYAPKKGHKYILRFGHVYVAPPQVIEEDRTLHSIWPNDARLRNLSYDSAIQCDIQETYINDTDEKNVINHNRVMIGRVPVMLQSDICHLSKNSLTEKQKKGECANDPGGYFVIKGKERVLVGQIRAVYNTVFVHKQKVSDKYKYIAEVRSMSNETGHSVLLQAKIGNDDRTMCFSLPYIKELIPIGLVFKAMGYVTEQEIIDLIGLDVYPARNYIRYICRDSFTVETQDEACEYIGKFSIHSHAKDNYTTYAWQVLETDLLPHLGASGTIKQKACFLGNMVNKLLCTAIGLRTPDNRDSYANRRIEISGILMYDLFRTLFKRYVSEIKMKLDKKKQNPDILSIISRMKGTISKGLQTGFTSGNWGVYKNAYVKTGVSQVLDRMTYSASLSHLHRLVIPIGKEGKNMEIRQIHPSQYGMICPCECFDPNTSILMWNGSTKIAKDIVVGDLLIDDNALSTLVKSTVSGKSQMYQVKQKNGMNYTVTGNHILTLINIINSDIIDIPIQDYINLPNTQKNKLNGFKCNKLCSSFLQTPIEVAETDIGPFVGWQLEGNQRFLGADYTVLHNSPEGKSAGIALNTSLMVKFSKKIQPILVQEILDQCTHIIPINKIKLNQIKNTCDVFLNGVNIGITQEPQEVIEFVKNARSRGSLDKEVSVSYDEIDEDVRIYCDEGRIMRPLMVMKNNSLVIEQDNPCIWSDLLSNNIIEYIDSAEIESSVIAMYPSDIKHQKSNFCEINPIAMLGVIAAMIPFSDHSQGPRNAFQSNMGKQALGIPMISYQRRADTVLYVMSTPQRPLVSTKVSDMLNMNEMPCGINAIVAILSYTGRTVCPCHTKSMASPHHSGQRIQIAGTS
jgi:DNA-directed RNA polymerase beta subunit